MKLQGRLVVLTGASQGIGAAAAVRLAREGARLVLMARTASKLEEVAEAVRGAGGQAWAFPVDLTEGAAVLATAERVLAEVGVPDVLVNNAGVGRWLSVDETEPDEAVAMIGAPYLAAFFVCRGFLPAMIRRGSGMIVNLNSPVSRAVWPGAAGYAASRWALRGLTEALAQESGQTGIAVVEYLPGEVSSSYFDNNPGAHDRMPTIAAWLPVLTPARAADGLVYAIHAERRVFAWPYRVRALFWMNAVAPWAVRWALRVTGWRRGRA